MRAAIPRSGRQRSAISSSRRASGRFFSPRASLAASCKAMSPAGKGVGMSEAEQQENIRRPRADSLDRDKRAMRVFGDERAKRDEVEPVLATACANARMARIFGEERPQARSFSSLAARTVSARQAAPGSPRRV